MLAINTEQPHPRPRERALDENHGENDAESETSTIPKAVTTENRKHPHKQHLASRKDHHPSSSNNNENQAITAANRRISWRRMLSIPRQLPRVMILLLAKSHEDDKMTGADDTCRGPEVISCSLHT